ncbi:hypothetical protein GCK72_008988 [Caenorhabditis remanei]|uniref:T20D4.11-like domain-containing protein n=1 Tax=Caenorhabditis remanei TaxID=31234 RepID=A0A6A5H159_CAERE|nr:hypothetical protein GCK72_008988 [Caenorhabditis remanei]KAF1760739.1 hypothetical protein GCK72_008988 [Caenorhabditis remanei]
MSWLFILVPFIYFTLTTEGKPTSLCAIEVIGPKISKCLFTLQNMTEIGNNYKNKRLDVEKQKAYLEDCEFFSTCRSDFECLKSFTSEVEVAFIAVEVECKSAKFIVNDFSSCGKKLDDRNSTCSQDYNPFPGIKPEDVPSILVNGRKESCDDLFGDKDCMKTEIIELCGEDEYEKFRQMQVELAKSLRMCDAKV